MGQRSAPSRETVEIIKNFKSMKGTCVLKELIERFTIKPTDSSAPVDTSAPLTETFHDLMKRPSFITFTQQGCKKGLQMFWRNFMKIKS